MHSNTTLVKVKSKTEVEIEQVDKNSNTTLVKVKLVVSISNTVAFLSIQIQHLLKLNEFYFNMEISFF